MLPEIPCSSLIGMRQILEQRGLDADAIAKEADFPPEALDNEALLVSINDINKFFEQTIERTNDRFLLLELAKYQGWYILFLLLGSLSRSKSLGELLQVLTSSLELYTPAISCYIHDGTEGIWFGYEIRQNFLEEGRIPSKIMQITELGMVINIMEIQQLLGRFWYSTYVQFMHAPPDNRHPLEEVFGINLHFNQDRNAIYLARDEVNTPIPDGWYLGLQIPH